MNFSATAGTYILYLHWTGFPGRFTHSVNIAFNRYARWTYSLSGHLFPPLTDEIPVHRKIKDASGMVVEQRFKWLNKVIPTVKAGDFSTETAEGLLWMSVTACCKVTHCSTENRYLQKKTTNLRIKRNILILSPCKNILFSFRLERQKRSLQHDIFRELLMDLSISLIHATVIEEVVEVDIERAVAVNCWCFQFFLQVLLRVAKDSLECHKSFTVIESEVATNVSQDENWPI